MHTRTRTHAKQGAFGQLEVLVQHMEEEGAKDGVLGKNEWKARSSVGSLRSIPEGKSRSRRASQDKTKSGSSSRRPSLLLKKTAKR